MFLVRRESPPLWDDRGVSTPTIRAGLSLGWSGLLALLVTLPWLKSGYFFGTDWPGPRHLSFPHHLSSSAPTEAILAALAQIFGSEWVGKGFVVAILFGAAVTAFQAVPSTNQLARMSGAAIYVLNPFVYG